MSTGAFLDRFGLRYAAGARATVGVLMAVAAPFAAPPGGMALCAAVSAVLAAWSLTYLWLMRTRPATWVWVVDMVVVCALCLAQSVLVDPVLLVRFLGWVSPVMSLAVVALQWHTHWVAGMAATVVVCVCYVVGAALSPEITVLQAVLAGGAWTLVEALLGRLVWRLVRTAGAYADERMAARFAVAHAAELARARRAGQRAHWATVHDTAASTLLMVELGGVRGDEEWLAAQLARDVAALRGEPTPSALACEVVRRVAATARVAVDVRCEGGDLELPGPVAGAVGGAVAESLENVARHAGTDRAEVTLVVAAGRLRIAVRDEGRGFDPAVSTDRFGLARSVVERMAQVDGAARVESAPGAGTAVLLGWPR